MEHKALKMERIRKLKNLSNAQLNDYYKECLEYIGHLNELVSEIESETFRRIKNNY